MSSTTDVASSHVMSCFAPSRITAARLRKRPAYEPGSLDGQLPRNCRYACAPRVERQTHLRRRCDGSIGLQVLNHAPDTLGFKAETRFVDVIVGWHRFQLVLLNVDAKLDVRSLDPSDMVPRLGRANGENVCSENGSEWVGRNSARGVSKENRELRVEIIYAGGSRRVKMKHTLSSTVGSPTTLTFSTKAVMDLGLPKRQRV